MSLIQIEHYFIPLVLVASFLAIVWNLVFFFKDFRKSILKRVVYFTLLFLFSLSAYGAERHWTKDPSYWVEPCTINPIDLEEAMEEAFSQFEPHSVRFTKAPFEQVADILVTCNRNNPYENALSVEAKGTTVVIEDFGDFGTTYSHFYTDSGEMIDAHIWLNEFWVRTLKGPAVRLHEVGHVIGLEHVESDTLMHAQFTIDYLDSQTIGAVLKRYNRTHSAVDTAGERIIPCLWVPQEIATLFGEKAGFFTVRETMRDFFWEVTDFERASQTLCRGK